MATAYVEYPLTGERANGAVTLVDIDTYGRLDGKGLSWHHGYAQMRPFDAPTGVFVSPTRLHREVLGLTKGDGRVVDHINHNRLDNRRANLRVGDLKMNNANSPSRRGPFTKGVYQLGPGRYRACVNYSGTQHHLGVFATQREAWEAAETWRRERVAHYIPQDS